MGINFEKLNKTIKNEEVAVTEPKTTVVAEKKAVVNVNSGNDKTDTSNRIKIAVDKINAIEKELSKNTFLEMESEIEMILIAIMSGTNAFLQGPAGTAKSDLTETIAQRITNSKYFRLLVGKTTEPAEIFGPTSLQSLKNDIIRYNTENRLPTSEIVFLDEIFKCSSAVLNSLLTAMNEKLFFNDVVEEIPLISLIGASNEYPDEQSLVALYDRFLLRYPRRYIQDHSKRISMFKNFVDKRYVSSSLNEVAASDTFTKIDVEEIRLLIEAAKEIKVPMGILKAYNNLLISVEKETDTVISDRRKNEALKAIQALALKRGLDTVTVAEFEVLRFILWEREKDIHVIDKTINRIANPNLIIIQDYKTIINSLQSEIKDDSHKNGTSEDMINRTIKIAGASQQLKTAEMFVETKINETQPGTKDNEEFNNILKDIHELQKIVTTEIQG